MRLKALDLGVHGGNDYFVLNPLVAVGSAGGDEALAPPVVTLAPPARRWPAIPSVPQLGNISMI
jgi:hypothetical protein